MSSPGTDPCHCSISRLAQLNYILTFRMQGTNRATRASTKRLAHRNNRPNGRCDAAGRVEVLASPKATCSQGTLLQRCAVRLFYLMRREKRCIPDASLERQTPENRLWLVNSDHNYREVRLRRAETSPVAGHSENAHFPVPFGQYSCEVALTSSG